MSNVMSDGDRRYVQLSNLVSGRAYTITVFTVSGAEESLPASEVFYTSEWSDYLQFTDDFSLLFFCFSVVLLVCCFAAAFLLLFAAFLLLCC